MKWIKCKMGTKGSAPLDFISAFISSAFYLRGIFLASVDKQLNRLKETAVSHLTMTDRF